MRQTHDSSTFRIRFACFGLILFLCAASFAKTTNAQSISLPDCEAEDIPLVYVDFLLTSMFLASTQLNSEFRSALAAKCYREFVENDQPDAAFIVEEKNWNTQEGFLAYFEELTRRATIGSSDLARVHYADISLFLSIGYPELERQALEALAAVDAENTAGSMLRLAHEFQKNGFVFQRSTAYEEAEELLDLTEAGNNRSCYFLPQVFNFFPREGNIDHDESRGRAVFDRLIKLGEDTGTQCIAAQLSFCHLLDEQADRRFCDELGLPVETEDYLLENYIENVLRRVIVPLIEQ